MIFHVELTKKLIFFFSFYLPHPASPIIRNKRHKRDGKLTKANVRGGRGGGGKCKTNRNEQVGEGSQKLEVSSERTFWMIPKDTFSFDFLEKCLGIVSAPHFVYDFSRKMFFMLYSVNWPNSIVWWLLLLDILGNMCIAVVCFPGCDVTDLEINLSSRHLPAQSQQ